MMKKLFLVAILFTPCLPVHAGVAIGGTRFVYEEKNPQLNITLENSDDRPYLIKTQILPNADSGVTPTGNVPFVATPPLFLLNGKKQNQIRVVSSDNQLSKDKESLFDLVVTAIPSSGEKESSNTVQVAIRSHMKLIYRPSGLQGNPEKAYQQLGWLLSSQGLSIRNPTPFYITLFNTTVNGKKIETPAVLAPFSVRQTFWCKSNSHCQIHWQAINDFGKVLPSLNKDITKG